MSKYEIKVVSVLMEMLWWGGLLGLVYESFCGRYSFSAMCCAAMILCLRWQTGLNTGSLKTIIGALERLDIAKFLREVKKR